MGFFSDLWYKATGRANGLANDPNFGTALQLYTPGQPIYSDKNYAEFVRSGYKKNPAVYTCINLISGAAAGIEWKLYTDRTRKRTIDKHPLLDLWRNPNPRMPSTGSFIEQVFGFWLISGNAYIWAFCPNPNEAPLALWALRPDRMKAVAGENNVSGYVYGYGTSGVKDYDASEICHIKFPGYDDDIYGLSPLQVASYFADQQNEAMGWNLALMQNAGRPASAFFAKGYLTEEQRNQIKREIQRNYSGKRNAGRPLVLEADMTWQNMSLTPMELDFLKSYELGTRAICAIYNVAPELAGDSAGKTFANVSEARQALYLENALPKLDRFSDFLNAWFVPMYPDLKANGAYFSYNRDDIEALQALYAAQKKAVHDMARADWMAGGITLDEYCELIGANKPKYGAVRRIGAILVSEDSMEDYADQSLTEPAAPPMPVPEPLNLPGANPNQPALPAPATSKQPANPSNPKNPKPASSPKTPAKGSQMRVEVKEMDSHGIYQPDDLQARLAAYKAANVQYLTWVCSKDPCEVCSMNDGQTVELGQPFFSGHILPVCHPHCNCQVVPAQTLTGKSLLDELARKVAQHLAASKVAEQEEKVWQEIFSKPHVMNALHRMAQEAKREIHHEENSTVDARMDTGKDGSMQLRFMSVSPETSEKALASNGNGVEQAASMTNRQAYQQFMEMYT